LKGDVVEWSIQTAYFDELLELRRCPENRRPTNADPRRRPTANVKTDASICIGTAVSSCLMVHILRWSLWADLNLRSSVTPARDFRGQKRTPARPLTHTVRLHARRRVRPATGEAHLEIWWRRLFGLWRQARSIRAFQWPYLYKT
jgi:hypothetical protein